MLSSPYQQLDALTPGQQVEVLKDGKVIAVTSGPDEAFSLLLRLCLSSVARALQYDGWSVRNVPVLQ